MAKKTSKKLITFSFLLQSSWKFLQSKFIGVQTKCLKRIIEFIFSKFLGVLKARGWSRGHFGMFCSYEGTFYCWTAAFYGIKISYRVKKLLRFEGRSLHVFSIQIYRGNLAKIWCFLFIFFFFFDLSCSKSFLNDRDWWILLNLADFSDKNAKIWKILPKLGQI